MFAARTLIGQLPNCRCLSNRHVVENAQTRDERAKLVFRVKIGLPNDDGLFKPGMPAAARFLGVAR